MEDVITSGGSAQKAITAVRDAGGVVLGVLAVVDRLQGGRAHLEGLGHTVVVAYYNGIIRGEGLGA